MPPVWPDRLPLTLQEIIAFQADKSTEVRKFVIGFIEEAWYGVRASACSS